MYTNSHFCSPEVPEGLEKAGSVHLGIESWAYRKGALVGEQVI